MRNTPLPADLHYQLLLREPLYAVMHRDHPLAQHRSLSVRALTGEPFIFFDAQSGTALYGAVYRTGFRCAVSFSPALAGSAYSYAGAQHPPAADAAA
ncbi:hypothetical protein CRX72_17730 [Pantoea sp. BRM17]|nr:hypothetical protein CRX72_17730 [Pantoea sp. BRM17]